VNSTLEELPSSHFFRIIILIKSGGTTRMMKIGLCKDLEGNVFDFGTTLAAVQMQILQEKIAQYIGEKYGEDTIANELQNETKVVIPTPAYASTALTRYMLQIALVRNLQATMNAARLASSVSLEAEIVRPPNDLNLVIELAF
jgi:hypothetical protein